MHKDANKDYDDIYVVGCGPSLRGFNWALLRDRTTIAVNGAVIDVPEPDYLITADSRFIRMAAHRHFWDVSTYKVAVMRPDHRCFHNVKKELEFWDCRIEPQRFDGNVGFSEDEFCTGQNSGFCGMQLAVILGARFIHLLGMDFHVEGGEHYHSHYDSDPERLDEFLAHFRTAIKILGDNNVKVISHSPTSRLNDMIEFISL